MYDTALGYDAAHEHNDLNRIGMFENEPIYTTGS